MIKNSLNIPLKSFKDYMDEENQKNFIVKNIHERSN